MQYNPSAVYWFKAGLVGELVAEPISGVLGWAYLLKPYFWMFTVRPLALANYYITLAPWAERGRLAISG